MWRRLYRILHFGAKRLPPFLPSDFCNFPPLPANSVFLSTRGTTRLVPNDAAWSSSLNTCYGNSSDTWQPPRPMAETLVHVPVVPQRGLKAPRSHGWSAWTLPT